MMRSQYRAVIIIACLSAMLSLAYAFYYHDRPRADALGYDRIGWNLAQGNGYIEDVANIDRPAEDWAINRVGPGYQFFLAGLYFLFGHQVWVVWVAHALLRVVSTVLVWLIARKLFPDDARTALVAALLFALSPDFILVSGLLLTETLYAAVMLAALLGVLAIFEIRRPATGLTLITGFFFAVALLVRPTTLFVVMLFCAILIYQKRWRELVASLVLPILIVGSWSVFATMRFDRFILTTGVGAYDLWVGNSPGATGGFEKTPEVQEARNTMSHKELDAYSKKKYWEFFTTQPLEFMQLQVRKTTLYFSTLRPGGYWPHLYARAIELRATLAASMLWTIALFVAGIAGALVLFQTRQDLGMRFLLGAALLQPISVIPLIVETRYRYPLLLLLIFFGAYAMTHLGKAKQAFLYASIVLSIATFGDFVFHMSDILEKARRIF
ncbi:MAG: glycosyltransferase family 39 protein [Patescibacteria group bacterium]